VAGTDRGGKENSLRDAEGRWPDYPQTLVAIASKHPSVAAPNPPLSSASCPCPLQTRLKETKKGSTIKKNEGKVKD